METANKEIDRNALRWYAVYTAAQAENGVRQLLEKAGIESYLPLQSVVRVWNNYKRKLMIPVVPKCVFVHLTANQMERVKNIKGISFLLKEDGEHVSISEQQMNSFRCMVDNTGEFIEFTEDFTPEDLVRVIHGSLAGFTGNLVRYEGKDRLVLPIKGLGCALTAVAVDSFEKIK